MFLSWFYQHCIPADIKKNTLDCAYAKNLVGSAVSVFFAMPILTSVYLLLHYPTGALIVFAESLFVLCAIYLLKYIKNLSVIREAIVISIWLTVASLTFLLGGILSTAAYWFILPPLLNIFFGGIGGGFMWGWISFASVFVLFMLDWVGGIVPASPIESVLLLQAPSIIVLIGIVLWLFYLFETSRRTYAKGLEQASAELVIARDIAQDLAQIAQEGSHAKSAFLAAMSHEMRTPLNGIMGMSEILAGSELSPNQKMYLDTILSSSKHLLSVIDNVLDFSKIESEHMEVQAIPFNLHSLVDDVVQSLSVAAHQKHLNFGVWIDSSIPEALMGDPVRIRQVLTNLLGNAVKFTEQGAISARIQLIESQQGILIVLFEITDTGIGIAPSIRPKLFQQFTQGEASVSRTYGGTGLGLAIAKRLVELMKGTIGLDSQMTDGSRFWFKLPLAVCDASLELDDVKGRSAMKGLKALYLGPRDIHCEVVNDALALWGIACDWIGDMKKALHGLQNKAHPDLYQFVFICLSSHRLIEELYENLSELKNIGRVKLIFLLPLGQDEEDETLAVLLTLGKVVYMPVQRKKLYQTIVDIV